LDGSNIRFVDGGAFDVRPFRAHADGPPVADIGRPAKRHA